MHEFCPPPPPSLVINRLLGRRGLVSTRSRPNGIISIAGGWAQPMKRGVLASVKLVSLSFSRVRVCVQVCSPTSIYLSLLPNSFPAENEILSVSTGTTDNYTPQNQLLNKARKWKYLSSSRLLSAVLRWWLLEGSVLEETLCCLTGISWPCSITFMFKNGCFWTQFASTLGNRAASCILFLQ